MNTDCVRVVSMVLAGATNTQTRLHTTIHAHECGSTASRPLDARTKLNTRAGRGGRAREVGRSGKVVRTAGGAHITDQQGEQLRIPLEAWLVFARSIAYGASQIRDAVTPLVATKQLYCWTGKTKNILGPA